MLAVVISTQLGWHGGEAQASLLALGLRQRGHRVHIFARSGGRFAERLASSGLPVTTFGSRGRHPLAVWRLRSAIARLRPDLIYYNDPHALTAGIFATAGSQRPVRLTARRVAFPIRVPGRYRRGCDRLICVSQAVADVARRCGIPGHHIRVVYDGVDPARVLGGLRDRGRQALGLTPDQPLLLKIGKLTPCKGHRDLFEALPAITRVHPNLCLALAGDGELRGELESRVRRVGVDRHVRFLGYREDIPNLIMASDLVVHASRMEGLCTSLIDAMHACRPIVATTAGGIPDLLTDPESKQPVGWLVPPAQPEALSAAVLRALDSPQQAQQLAALAQRRAAEHFTADRMVAATLQVYAEAKVGRLHDAA